MITETRDQLMLWEMESLKQSTWWKVILKEIDKWLEERNAILLDVRANVNDYKYNEDQLLKEQIKFLQKLKNLPDNLIKLTTSYHEDRSSEL